MAGIVAPGKIPKPQPRSLPASMGGGVGTSGIQRPQLGGVTPPPMQGGTSVLPDGTMRTIQPGLTPGLYLDPGSGGMSMSNQGGGGFIHEKQIGGGMPSVRAAMPPPSAAPAPGATPQAAPAPPPIDMNEIMNLVKTLKGEPVPREAAPQPLARVAAPEPAADAPSSSLAFARYKDRSGRIGNQALKALRDEMTSRGISGSGIEAGGVSSILGEVARGQGDAEYAQQRAHEDQAWDAKKMGYQGDISQRANDMGLVGTGFSGGITQRGQDMQTNDMTSLFPSIMSILMQQRRY